MKVAAGKLTVPAGLPHRVADAGLAFLVVTAEHAWAVQELTGLVHGDPFDRLLLAQSRVERLPFVTADRAMLAAELRPAVELVDARD